MNKLQVEPSLEHLKPALLAAAHYRVGVVPDEEYEPPLRDVLRDDGPPDHALQLVVLEHPRVRRAPPDHKVPHEGVRLPVDLSHDLGAALKPCFRPHDVVVVRWTLRGPHNYSHFLRIF